MKNKPAKLSMKNQVRISQISMVDKKMIKKAQKMWYKAHWANKQKQKTIHQR